MGAREELAAIRERATWATEGPWAPWTDQDGAEHMHGLLMVGNAEAVIPDGESWVEGVDVNPIAHTYTPEDRTFIAHARTDVPRLVEALEAVLGNADRWYREHPPHDRTDYAKGYALALADIDVILTAALTTDTKGDAR